MIAWLVFVIVYITGFWLMPIGNIHHKESWFRDYSLEVWGGHVLLLWILALAACIYFIGKSFGIW